MLPATVTSSARENASHRVFMDRALRLAQKGEGFTNPNPLVGAVIVRNGKVIAEGYHKCYGGDHAEAAAIAHAAGDVRGADMYVTLEPCSHYGKTPPCTEAIISSGIQRVIVSIEDPNPVVSGRGIEALRAHGIEVITGIREEESRKQNEIFLKYITTGLPFCIMKTAMTLDGKIATITGDSKWVTNELSRQSVHHIRNRTAAIMVGVETVIQDDPMLTVRLGEIHSKNPIRIVADSCCRIPLSSQILRTAHEVPTIIAVTELAPKNSIDAVQAMGAQVMIMPVDNNNKVDLKLLTLELGKKGIDSILLEGGSELNFSALESGIVDKVQTYIAPKIIGGDTAKTPVGGAGIQSMVHAAAVRDIRIMKFGEDFMIEGYIQGKN